MARYKSVRGRVRLASTKGKIIYVDDAFVKVPPELEEAALKARCIPESIFQEAVNFLRQEEAVVEEEVDDERKNKVIGALQKLAKMKEAGEEETPGGQRLEYGGKPRVDAVSELAGFRVKMVEIEEVLG